MPPLPAGERSPFELDSPNRNDRLAEIERKLDALIEAVRGLKREVSR
jgi:hypothetical protein